MSPRKTYALRQPDCAMSAELSGGSNAVPRPLMVNMTPNAKPRRLSNQPDTTRAYGSGVKANPQAYATTGRNPNSPAVCDNWPSNSMPTANNTDSPTALLPVPYAPPPTPH